MKKILAMAFCFALVLSLIGCGAAPTGRDLSAAGSADAPNSSEAVHTEETTDTEKDAFSQKAAVLKEPPALTVICGEDTRIEALKGTYSWMYQNEDGTEMGITADSVHPLQAKEYMPSLKLLPVITSSHSTLKAEMHWDIVPDEVSVRRWDEKDWGQPDSESEALSVRMLMIDADVEMPPVASVELKDGNCIYEVIAEWNRSEKYRGTVCYSFYTVKSSLAEAGNVG